MKLTSVGLGALVMAAAVASSAAGAQSWVSAGIGSGSAFGGSTGVSSGRGSSGNAVLVSGGGRHRGDFRRHRGSGEGVVFGDWDREYQGDTLWQPNSFNDWWHERPNRSFPRWMQNNQNCERQWWGGGTWRC